MTSPSGKPAPTQALIDTKKALIQTLLRVNGDPSATVASLSFSLASRAGPDMLIVEGTTDDMDSLKRAADAAEAAGLPSIAGWITSGAPGFPDAAADPELTDSQKAGRRRSSSKRVRKVTRRRRHRKGSRKLRSKLL